MQLQELHSLPNGFLESSATQLYNIIPQPTLIHLPGQRQEPLLVSVLLHGNETTGFYAIQALLKKYQQRQLPRALSLFIGNVEAARYGLRRLENQVDYNRVWTHPGFSDASKEAGVMRQVLHVMQHRSVFASIDVHNNTGLNPHYACVNKLQHNFLQLALLFSRTVIYFIRPQGVQSQAMAQLCPAVTIECGKTEHRQGISHALEFIEACLHLSHLPDKSVTRQDIDLFHTKAIVKVSQNVSFSFNDASADIVFVNDLEKMNFSELREKTRFAKVNDPDKKPFQVINEDGEDVYNLYFSINDGYIETTTKIMPSMLTTEVDIIHKDCLCYIMERISLPDQSELPR